MTAGPLSDVRVLDLTQMLAGPIAAMRLGDLGADVIKIEPMVTGEFNRTHGFDDIHLDGEMSTFVAVNRNKRSVAIDLKQPEGRAALLDLAADSDVLLQNFRAGTAARLGIGPLHLAEANPSLVYCSITGYGSTGPYRDRPGQDLVVQGYSGSMFSVGTSADPPMPGALWAADVMTGYQAVIGILAAVHHVRAGGTGQHVEVDMLSVVLDAQLQEYVTHLNTGWSPTRTAEESAHAAIGAPYGVYRTSDGWLTLAMCPIERLGEVLDDDWMRGLTAYNDGHIHRDAIYARIRHAFEHRTTGEWLDELDRVGVWAGPVHDYVDVARDPHVVETGMIVTQPHRSGSISTVRPPIRLSATPTRVHRGAPPLGADTREVLAEVAGYDTERIERLVSAGTVGVTTTPDPPTDRHPPSAPFAPTEPLSPIDEER